jgi:hypothetical protein
MTLLETIGFQVYGIKASKPETCDHDFSEYEPPEYEALSGRETVLQFSGGWFCRHCDQQQEDE